MKDSETLLKATLNRLKVRVEKKLTHSIKEIAINAKDLPEMIKQELVILKDEIIEEASRIENEEINQEFTRNGIRKENQNSSPKKEIYEIKSILLELNKMIDSNS